MAARESWTASFAAAQLFFACASKTRGARTCGNVPRLARVIAFPCWCYLSMDAVTGENEAKPNKSLCATWFHYA